MSTRGALVVGVDPGGTTGVCWFLTESGCPLAQVGALQIHGPEGVLPYVRSRIDAYGTNRRLIIAAEKFVVRGRAGRSRTASGGETARELLGELRRVEREMSGVVVLVRPAGIVKPWATDRRLEPAGLFDVTRSMPHARDAARHALYAAVKAGLLADPLSTERDIMTANQRVADGAIGRFD